MFHRAHLRLRQFDYSSDRAYFVTLCTFRRRCLLGRVVEDRVRLSTLGRIVDGELTALPRRRTVDLDAFVVMPNHVHAIVFLGASPLSLGDVLGGFKSACTREAGIRLWQRGFYDHIIREEDDLERIRRYITTNPIRWALDPENPVRIP